VAELYAALDCGAVAATHPFYTSAVREFEASGRTVVGSAPVGHDGTAAWLAGVGDALGLPPKRVAASQNAFLPAIREALSQARIDGSVTVSGYEGSELLVARLLIESGASVPYVGTACPKTPWNAADAEWLEGKGAAVRFRVSLEDDCAAMEALRPSLAIGTTPVVQKAKELGVPALYFTNLISARPLMGPAGAGSLIDVVNSAIAGKDRMERMRDCVSGEGDGDSAGIWEGDPNLRPDFRALHQRKLDRAARSREAERMI